MSIVTRTGFWNPNAGAHVGDLLVWIQEVGKREGKNQIDYSAVQSCSNWRASRSTQYRVHRINKYKALPQQQFDLTTYQSRRLVALEALRTHQSKRYNKPSLHSPTSILCTKIHHGHLSTAKLNHDQNLSGKHIRPTNPQRPCIAFTQ